ncbi:MAG: hypothetical protein GY856_14990 [bacterium]|nr:hypothetical protein [bacterium]
MLPSNSAVLVERHRFIRGHENQPAGPVEIDRKLAGPVMLEGVRATGQEVPDSSGGSKISQPGP